VFIFDVKRKGEKLDSTVDWKLTPTTHIKELFFAKSTFFHAGQREKKSFFHAEITFFHAGITFFHAAASSVKKSSSSVKSFFTLGKKS
jgi:hypothetical protein